MHARARNREGGGRQVKRELQLRERHYSRRFPKEIRKREVNIAVSPYRAGTPLRPRQVTNVIFTE